MNRAKIISDIDGVVLDLHPDKMRRAQEIFPGVVLSPGDFHPDRIKKTVADAETLEKIRVPVHLLSDPAAVPLIDGAREGLGELAEIVELSLLSTRKGDDQETASRALLAAHGIDLPLEYTRAAADKHDLLAGTKLYIDDSLRKLRGIRADLPDLPLIWFDQFGLADRENPAPEEKIFVARTWPEIVDFAKTIFE